MRGDRVNIYFNKTEDQIFVPVMEYVDSHPEEKLILEWHDGARIITQLDTAYDSMNDLNEEELGFEEYFACAMKTIEIVTIGTAPVWNFDTGGLFEVNYHNFPDIVLDSKGTVLLVKSKLLSE